MDLINEIKYYDYLQKCRRKKIYYVKFNPTELMMTKIPGIAPKS